MASLKDIKRKIKSVQNTQKTTRAMKLVSTSKLKKAEEFARRSRAYAAKLDEVLADICYKEDKYRVDGNESRYFQIIEKPKMVDIVFVTADKGLCGGFNATTIKAVKTQMNIYKKLGIKVRLRAIGKKGVAYFNFNEIELLDSVSDLSSHPSHERASQFITGAVKDYLDGVTDKIVLIHNGYKNMISQELKVKDLFPIDVSKSHVDTSLSMMESEPEESEEVLDQLAKKYVEYSMYYALIDSLAAEHSARMQAMDAATNNAKELVRSLSVKYNKARQEAITTELVEINTGVEAMK